MTTWLPTFMKDMGIYLSDPTTYMYGRWDQPASKNEGGVDLASPGGTPVYAIADGNIIGAGNFWHCADLYNPSCGGNPGYGVVTTRVTVPGYGLEDLYYQHIEINPAILSCQGNCTQSVHKGDLLGTIHSDVGELEMGFNADWGGVWGVNHPGSWVTDPRPMLVSLLNTGIPSILGNQPTYSGLAFNTTSTGGTLSSLLGFDIKPILPWLNNPVRIFKLVTGILVLITAIVLLLSPDMEMTAAKAIVKATRS